MRLKTSIKKISAIGLSLAMTIGMVPIWSTQALAETAQKAYEVILEPTMVYDNVYSSFGNKFIVPVYRSESLATKCSITFPFESNKSVPSSSLI